MQAICTTFAVILAALVLPLSSATGNSAQPAPKASFAEGNTAFALDLYGQLKGAQGNLFFSPYSISTCLAMTWAGARGNTETQMAQVLHFSGSQSQVHSSFGELQGRLREAQKQKGIELSIANALWAQKGHPFLPAFLDVARKQYEASLNQADFTTQADSAIHSINQWVSEKTKGRIQDILGPRSLNSATRLVLADAIYFKGRWADPFEKSATSAQPFHLAQDREASAMLMCRTEQVRYTEGSDFQAVELPYIGNALSMVILLPRQVEGCKQLESSLTAANLSSWLAQMRRQKAVLFIPKFKTESAFELTKVLSAMGMTDAFGTKANFSGMDGGMDLFISSVRHKAWVEVAEEGTEAAAATVATVAASAMPRPSQLPPVFRADHPFIFLIRDTRSGSILFLGRLADPTK